MALRRLDWPMLLIIGIALLMNAFAKVHGTDGDAYGTLLVSDSILRFGSLSLENYPQETLDLYTTRIRPTNGVPFYYFPIGTALISMPFVAVAELLGLDVIRDDALLQRWIAGFTSVLTILYSFRIARQLRNDQAGWMVPATFWFGTVLSTTTGLALESHNFAIVIALFAIDEVIRIQREQVNRSGWIIGIALFLAYLTRPTFSIFAIFLLVWLFSISRMTAIRAGLILLLMLGGFVLFCLEVYGQPFPEYYLPKRLEGGEFATALLGNLVSPARGLLVFSSFIGLVWAFTQRRNFRYPNPWLFVGLLWPIIHLVLISRFPHWWGGHSYGPRLMVDCLPGLLLLTLHGWPTYPVLCSNKIRASLLVGSVMFSCVINAGQGMFNPSTADWSNAPDIDQYPEYLFDWKYPLFLANERGHRKRALEFKAIHHKDAWPKKVN